MKYDVHIFPVLHVKLVNIEAESHQDAMEKAEKYVWDNHRQFFSEPEEDVGIHYFELADGEEPSHFLVDEVGDEEYANSRWYNGDKSVMEGMS